MSLLTLLRLTPLLSSTASLTHAYMEHITTSSFLSPAPTTSTLSRLMLKTYTPASTPTPASLREVQHATEVAAPAWFVNFFNRGVWSVIGFNTVTLVSAGMNVWGYPEGLEGSRVYYIAGLVAAIGHYAFVPLIAPSIERLFRLCAAQEKGEDEDVSKEGKGGVESVREWVGVHDMRMGSVDVVAWVSFLVGVMGVLRA